jgi:aminoglycoside 2'-N-acetyltransferase I
MMADNPWEITIRPRGSIPEDVLDHIHTLLRETFIEEGDDTQWSDVDWHILITMDGMLVSHVEIVERDAQVGRDRLKLGGIGGVMTLPEWRGRGLAQAGMRKAQEFICEEMDADFGLLMCDPKMVTFYARLGWFEVDAPLVYDHPCGKRTFDDVVMVLSCTGRAWPDGMIDLCGYPW